VKVGQGDLAEGRPDAGPDHALVGLPGLLTHPAVDVIEPFAQVGAYIEALIEDRFHARTVALLSGAQQAVLKRTIAVGCGTSQPQ